MSMPTLCSVCSTTPHSPCCSPIRIASVRTSAWNAVIVCPASANPSSNSATRACNTSTVGGVSSTNSPSGAATSISLMVSPFFHGRETSSLDFPQRVAREIVVPGLDARVTDRGLRVPDLHRAGVMDGAPGGAPVLVLELPGQFAPALVARILGALRQREVGGQARLSHWSSAPAATTRPRRRRGRSVHNRRRSHSRNSSPLPEPLPRRLPGHPQRAADLRPRQVLLVVEPVGLRVEPLPPDRDLFVGLQQRLER